MGHGDGFAMVLITGRLLLPDGTPAKNPKFYDRNDRMLLGQSMKAEAPIMYDPVTGRFSYFTSVFAAHSRGEGQKNPGPFQTGSAVVLIEAEGAEPLTVSFYDEMPEVEIILSEGGQAKVGDSSKAIPRPLTESRKKKWLPLMTDEGTLYPPECDSPVEFMPEPSDYDGAGL
jgi:hypothetical protein